MKKILIIFISILFIINTTYAENDSFFDQYEKNVEKVCNEYKENKVVYNVSSYKEIKPDKTSFKNPIDFTIEKYKTDMNNIYNCAIIISQNNSLNLIQNKLQSNWYTQDFLNSLNKIKSRNDIKFKELKCINIDKNVITNKLSILRQTTYETCKYNYYMEYLKQYYINNNKDLINKNYNNDNYKNEIDWKSIVLYDSYINSFLSQIDYEITKSQKIFPIAYHAYTEYENNYPIHILLQLIKQDFVTYRENLYKVLNPIQQVAKKIVNAMSK